jgi:hypothetical protein
MGLVGLSGWGKENSVDTTLAKHHFPFLQRAGVIYFVAAHRLAVYEDWLS